MGRNQCGTMDEPNRERAIIKAYPPAFQKEQWVKHAKELGMSQSEYVKTMIQAGRRVYQQKDPQTVTDDTTKVPLSQFAEESEDEDGNENENEEFIDGN